MAHTELLLKLLIISITLFAKVSSSTTILSVKCAKNCDIQKNGNATKSKEGVISGKAGDDITLKYTIHSTNFGAVKVEYDNIDIIMVTPTGLSVEHSIPAAISRLFDFSATKLKKEKDKYSFSLKLLSLNKTVHNGKQFLSQDIVHKNVTEQLLLTINVLPPSPGPKPGPSPGPKSGPSLGPKRPKPKSGGLQLGEILLIVIGVLVVLLIVVGIWLFRREQTKLDNEEKQYLTVSDTSNIAYT